MSVRQHFLCIACTIATSCAIFCGVFLYASFTLSDDECRQTTDRTRALQYVQTLGVVLGVAALISAFIGECFRRFRVWQNGDDAIIMWCLPVAISVAVFCLVQTWRAWTHLIVPECNKSRAQDFAEMLLTNALLVGSTMLAFATALYVVKLYSMARLYLSDRRQLSVHASSKPRDSAVFKSAQLA